MPSAATTRNKLEKQAPGENSGTWGSKEQTTLDQIDAALDGIFDVETASGTTTLADADYTADDAKNRVLNCTGTGGTIVIPNVEKNYFVRNASSGDVIISTGSGTTATVPSGSTELVISTGSNVVYSQFGGGFAANAKFGYATGSGGTVTQATSKGTGVTLNKLSGEITMNAANLAANSRAGFTFTNSHIAATDVLVINQTSGSSGNYVINAVCGAGSATIHIYNHTAFDLAEAVVLRFVVIKGVIA